MKLILKNFRCYTDKTFDIPDTGITLIHGPSGIGKSSICMAINFVLYGTGNKVVTHDKTTCSVEFILSDGMSIKRSKRPNYLTIDNGKYTDDSAQEVINQIFGHAFDITGYLEQGASNSFLLMSPANKSEFLERFAFRGIDIASMKEKVKSIIKLNETELLKTQGQLQLIKKMRDELTVVDKVIFPIKCKKEQQELAERNEHVKLKNISTFIKKEFDTISKLETEKLNLSVLYASIDISQLEALENEVEECLSFLLSITPSKYNGDEYVTLLETQISNISKIREYENLNRSIGELVETIKKMKFEEDTQRQEQIDKLKSTLWSTSNEEDTNNELETYIELEKLLTDAYYIYNRLPKNYKTFNVDDILTQITSIENNKKDEELKLTTLKEQITILSCPACSTPLRHINGELVKEHNIIETDDLMNDINESELKVKNYKSDLVKLNKEYTECININKIIKEYTNKLSEINEIYTITDDQPIEKVKKEITRDITNLKTYSSQNISNQKLITKLEQEIGKIYSQTILNMEKSLLLKEKSISIIKQSLVENDFDIKNEDDLRNELLQQKEFKRVFTEASLKYDKSSNKLNDLKHKFENLMKSHNILNRDDIKPKIDRIEAEISTHKEEIDRLEKSKVIHTENIEQIRKYTEYNLYLEKSSKFNTQIKELEETEKLWVTRVSGSTKFKDLISEAESMAVAGVISSINSHARIYLDDFFPENPIAVTLQTFKETKKATKPQINVEIDYKEMSCSLDTLSGGEVARVSLAYTLALAEMINSPIVMLDESTSNLDHEMANTIIHSIKDHMAGKTIIMVAHQAETGAYDNVIKL
jgi:DNA repair exonuclease SbcCD ATPase subunit